MPHFNSFFLSFLLFSLNAPVPGCEWNFGLGQIIGKNLEKKENSFFF
jgi:hypothetical protein